MEKFMKASPMNSIEECKCEECGNIIFEKELFMNCFIKGFEGDIKPKKYCCDCFKKKIDQDLKNIEKWSAKTRQELFNMIIPIQDYLQSETKQKMDNMRKMLTNIEKEGGL
jgi:hypothetical protein